MKRILLISLILAALLLSGCGTCSTTPALVTFSLITSTSPVGTGSVSPSSGYYQQGAQVNIQATPEVGYVFSHWSGDVSGTSNPVSVSMDSDKTVTAHFADITPPVISGVSVVNVIENSVTITWTTDEAATSQVEYGTTTGYGLSSTLDNTLVTSHPVNLTGLIDGTTYHYRVKSRDAASNGATSADLTFSTLADTTPPAISNVTTASITTSSATILWGTNEPATSQVEYGPTTAYGLLSPLDGTLVTSHSVVIPLQSSTVWHFRVRSRDAAGNEAVSSNGQFSTSKIAFDDFAENVIWIMNPDGSSQIRLTSPGNNDADPALSHDGSKIAFESRRTGWWEIHVMNADGTNVTHLVAGEDPAWSWDDTRIAFSQSGHLCVINSDGTGFQHLPTDGSSPSFSPDNQEIVFVKGFWNIFKINLQTLTVTQLSNVSWADSPAWAPDGSTIIYTDRSVGLQYSKLWAMNSDGTNKRALTPPDWGKEGAWSPDGTQVIYGTMVMDADGSNRREILTSAFMPENPSWA